MSKLTEEEYNKLINESNELIKKYPDIRLGQAYMNTLWKINGNLYRQITEEQKVDPFYLDKNIPEFFNFLMTD